MTATATSPIRLIMPADRSVAACCAESPDRRFGGMTHAEVTYNPEGTRAYITSTDGRCLTRAEVTCFGGSGKHYLHPSILKRGVIAGKGKAPTEVTVADGNASRANARGAIEVQAMPTDAERAAKPFPPTADLWGNPGKVFDPANKSISLNAELLAKMAEAIGRNGVVTIYFPDGKNRPATVIGENGVGLLMTCSRETKLDCEKYCDAFPGDAKPWIRT